MRATITLLTLSTLLGNAARAQDFTVISSNLWMSANEGFDTANGRRIGLFGNLPGFVTGYRRAVGRGYGVIGMQEASDRVLTYWNVPRLIARSMGAGWGHRFQGLKSGGHFGNAMATNVRLLTVKDWRFVWTSSNKTDYGNERRGAMAAKLDFGGKRLWFVNTHLSYKHSGGGKKPVAIRQAWQLMGRIKTLDPDFPVIVLGDFNLDNTRSGHREYRWLTAIFGAAGFVDVSNYRPTAFDKDQGYRAMKGQLDYIFVYDPHRRLRLRYCYATAVRTGTRIHSDHLALVARFGWR